MRCPDEQANYVNRIRECWAFIMEDEPGILDATTVELLQGRAPTLSTEDVEYINEVFAERLVFADVDDERRENFRARVLQIEYIIPSLHTFHEDIKYLEPMAKLVRGLLTPKFKGRIQDGMRRRYRGPATGDYYIQTSETGHRQESQNPQYGFWSAYRQVFLASMRYFFPLISGSQPLKIHKVPLNMRTIEPEALSRRFTELARSVGFVSARPNLQPSESIQEGLPLLPPLTTDSEEEWARYGMTDGRSFFSDKMHLYLDKIYSAPDNLQREHLTSFAVKRNFFLAFFPPYQSEGAGRGPNSPQLNPVIHRQPNLNDDELPDVSNQQAEPDQPTASNSTELTTQADAEMLDNPIAEPSSSRSAAHHRLYARRRKPGNQARVKKWAHVTRSSAMPHRRGTSSIINQRNATVRHRRSASPNQGTTIASHRQNASPTTHSSNTKSDTIILNQTTAWCEISVNISPGQFARSIEENAIARLGCVFNISKSSAIFIRVSHVEHFSEFISPDFWFAVLGSQGALSIINIMQIGASLRKQKMVFMGHQVNNPFSQYLLHPDIELEDIQILEIPRFYEELNWWQFEL
ncbi:hypothetical protein I7I53_07007 [Histoplasma capsulatum var. duboisii H88]|nr:hypothetical protein I7I53_07007 [Histoplasma capsulatum var. duboisii H88]